MTDHDKYQTVGVVAALAGGLPGLFLFAVFSPEIKRAIRSFAEPPLPRKAPAGAAPQAIVCGEPRFVPERQRGLLGRLLSWRPNQ